MQHLSAVESSEYWDEPARNINIFVSLFAEA